MLELGGLLHRIARLKVAQQPDRKSLSRPLVFGLGRGNQRLASLVRRRKCPLFRLGRSGITTGREQRNHQQYDCHPAQPCSAKKNALQYTLHTCVPFMNLPDDRMRNC